MAADWGESDVASRPTRAETRAELASQVPLRPRVGADASSERNRISKRKRIESASSRYAQFHSPWRSGFLNPGRPI
jgi:hypothetical protein